MCEEWMSRQMDQWRERGGTYGEKERLFHGGEKINSSWVFIFVMTWVLDSMDFPCGTSVFQY